MRRGCLLVPSVLQDASSSGRQLTIFGSWAPVRRCELEPDYKFRFETIRPVRKRSGVTGISMGKKSRRDRAAYGPLRPRGPTPRRSDDGVRLQPARREPSTQPKLTVAEVEAELRAAMAAIPPSEYRDNSVVNISQHPRCIRAFAALSSAVTLDEDDQRNFAAYLGSGQCRPGQRNMGGEEIIKIMKRWPRIRKYWPRFRRRICWGCGKEYDLSEPRLWVCGGCGDARYCDEACQRAHWPAHERQCLQTWHEKAMKRKSQGESWRRLAEEFSKLYPSRDM